MAGINTIISLLEPDEAADLNLDREAEAATAAGLSFVSLPIPDRGVPASTGAVVSLAAELEAALDEGKSVAIHCRQSVGRAGLMAAAVLAASGVDPGQAMETVQRGPRPNSAGNRRAAGVAAPPAGQRYPLKNVTP